MPEQAPRTTEDGHAGPVVASIVPRFAGPATFARLPCLDEVSDVDVAVVGVPFDGGVSYRPDARFGPAHVRASSRLLRPYNPAQEVAPFGRQQVADAGDIAVNPFSIEEAVRQIEVGADELLERSGRLLTIGGDHTIALPLLRSVARRHGPVAVVHFDAHLDTWDTYFGAATTHEERRDGLSPSWARSPGRGSWAPTSWRSRPRTTTRRSPASRRRTWPTNCCPRWH
jgi:agmatinase